MVQYMQISNIEVLEENGDTYLLKTKCPVNDGVDFIFHAKKYEDQVILGFIKEVSWEEFTKEVVQWYNSSDWHLRYSVKKEIFNEED